MNANYSHNTVLACQNARKNYKRKDHTGGRQGAEQWKTRVRKLQNALGKVCLSFKIMYYEQASPCLEFMCDNECTPHMVNLHMNILGDCQQWPQMMEGLSTGICRKQSIKCNAVANKSEVILDNTNHHFNLKMMILRKRRQTTKEHLQHESSIKIKCFAKVYRNSGPITHCVGLGR